MLILKTLRTIYVKNINYHKKRNKSIIYNDYNIPPTKQIEEVRIIAKNVEQKLSKIDLQTPISVIKMKQIVENHKNIIHKEKSSLFPKLFLYWIVYMIILMIFFI